MSRPNRSNQDHPTTDERRKTLAADLEAYLASGKTIEQIPTGFTNQDPLGGRRHIILGPSRNRTN
jgi:hypothetical protein